ncbi:A24 family peptidase [Phosphitispora sp. TUW77]|uniref:A24 family peptidase n=1 Tax=Phosphitispora sp. TUW77 TaxID=3152361 RepID=UPI003AB75413
MPLKVQVSNLIDIAVAVVVIISVYTDLKERKIYNVVILSGVLVGLLLNLLNYGGSGVLFSLKGLGAGLGLLFIPFALGGFGAGDVKLLGTIGALKGTLFVCKVFLATGIAGGVLAVFVLVKQKKLLTTLKRIGLSFFLLITSVFKVNTLKNLDKAEFHESLPYGLAIGIGTLAAYLVG